jgi:hypothetical protein
VRVFPEGAEHVMPVEYFETHFRTECYIPGWPAHFAIITAFATTGHRWSAQENADADHRLREKLRSLDPSAIRVTGFSPRTGHAEPGWAVEVSLNAAREIGCEFRQHALYFVQDDSLYVVACEGPEILYTAGSFRARLLVA